MPHKKEWERCPHWRPPEVVLNRPFSRRTGKSFRCPSQFPILNCTIAGFFWRFFTTSLSANDRNRKFKSKPTFSLLVRVENMDERILSSSDLPIGRYLRIEIEERDAGIPEEIRNRIFEVSFTAKPR